MSERTFEEELADIDDKTELLEWHAAIYYSKLKLYNMETELQEFIFTDGPNKARLKRAVKGGECFAARPVHED